MPENNIVNIREKNNPKSKTMVETIHTISPEDRENRSQHDDNGQKSYRRIKKRTGDKKEIHFYLGSRRRSSNRIDKNGERHRPEQNEYQQIIFTVPPLIHTRKKQASQSGRVFRNNARTKRNGRSCVTPAEHIASKFSSQ